jgi:hypothetical protein
MGAHRKPQHEEKPEQATAPAPPLPSLSAGLSPKTLSRAQVIALQRLVGNAAVVDMIDAHERPEADQPGAESESEPTAVAGEAEPSGGDLPGALGAGWLAGADGARMTQANGVAPGSIGAAAQDAEHAEAAAGAAGAQPDEPAAAGAPARGAVESPDTAAPAKSAAGGSGAAAAVVPGAGAAAGPATAVPGAAPGAAAAVSASAPTGAAAPTGPAAPGDIRDPHADPGFNAMKGAVKGAGAHAKTHQPAAAGAATAQGAAVPPGNDARSQAAAAQVDEMGKQQPGVFDKQAFIAAVKKAIDAAAPKNLEEADDFKDSGKAGKAKDEIHGQVKGGKQESEKNIKQATDAAPDPSKATPKPVTPMVNDEPGAPPADVGAAAAMPGPRPPQQTDLSGGPAEIDAKMAEADVTEEQIKKSNEPEFNAALEARDGARKQSTTAPAEYRAKEQDVLAKGRGEADATAGAELQGMHGARAQALTKVLGKKGETKSADEEKRAKVATDIQGIYDRTKADVTKTLDGLDGKVDAAFTKGEGAARAQFESYVDKRMSDYKDKRYSGLIGKGRWVKDKLAGMPDDVNRFYEDGKRSYLAAMDGVIGEIADIVGTELTAARTRIAQGRGEVQKYVAQLPADLREVGKEAEGKLESQFEQLSSDVDSKQDAMVDKLAKKYVEARDALDARIDELKAANKGLVDKALDKVVGVVRIILQLKDMLMGVLSRVAGAIGDILKDPVGFLGNLVAGVKGGLMRFVDNIAGHLQGGLMGWLFGALGGAGLTLPKSLDFAGILDLVTQVLGLTYQNVRARLAKAVGEPLVAKMERTVDVIRDFATKGVAGAWEWIKDKIGDLEEMVLGEIKEWVIFKVIKAGVLWIVSLLNPASAFIKACKAIYDIVMFIVERGAEILEFVNSVLDSIAAIAKGSLGGVAERVEGALAKALPLAISFLASLLGLGGISDKIRGVIDKVRSPINKAIDTVVAGAVKTFKKMFGPALKWAKKTYEKGKAFVKGKVDAGKKWVKGKARGIRGRLGGGSDSGNTPAASATPAAAAAGTTAPAPVDPEPVVKPFSMQGKPHQLTLDINPAGSLEVTMASRNAGSIVAKVNAEIESQDNIVKALPPGDTELIAYHTAAKAALQDIVTWYQSEHGRITVQYRSGTPQAVPALLRGLGEALAARVVQVAAQYRMEDFARRTFNISEHLDSIRAQVDDQIEKHKDNPDAIGDGMAYTAMAAEIYLGWVPKSGQRHAEKVAVATIAITKAIEELNLLKRNGIDMSGERYYVRGRTVLQMCEQALQDPRGFLWARGAGTLKGFIKDMDARGLKGNGPSVADVKRHLGMAVREPVT